MLAILILFITGLIVMFSGFYTKRDLAKSIALAGLATAFFSICLKFQLSLKFVQFFIWSPLAGMMTLLATFILFFLILNSKEKSQNRNSAVYALLLFSLCGAVLLFGATNLVTIFLGIEILSIPLYVLAASDKDQRNSLEAGIKYFILGSFSSAFLLFGIGLVYGLTGSFSVDSVMEVQKQIPTLPPFFHIGILMVLIAIFFKMAMAPFHFWSPDVYEGSPTLITGYMSTIVKIASAITCYYLLNGFFAFQVNVWIFYTLAIIGLTLFISSIMGLLQKDTKRLMAFSGMSHAAFIVLAIVMVLLTQKPFLLILYIFSYGIAGMLSFSVLCHEEKDGEGMPFERLNGLISRNKIAAIGLAVAILSMAGIPLTGGFIAKWNVLMASYNLTANYLFLGSTNRIIFGLLLFSSALGIVYYLKLLNHIFFYPNTIPNQDSCFKRKMILNLSVSVGVAILFALGLAPEFTLQFIQKLF